MPNVTILNRCEGQITSEYEIFNIPGIGDFSGIEAYPVESGFTATVTVNDVGYCKFQHWDDGDTSRTKTLVAGSEDIVLYAITGDAAVNRVVIGETILLDLSEDSLDSADELKYGETAHSRDGKVLTGTGRMVDQTQSVTQAKVPTDTTYTDTNGIKLNGTAEVIPSRTSYISDKNQTVYVGGGTASSPTAGYIPSGNGNIIEIDSASKTNLVSGNIKSGVSILGVDGELSSSDYSTFSYNSLFDNSSGGTSTILKIDDNYVTSFYGGNIHYLGYAMYPYMRYWCRNLELNYNNVRTITRGLAERFASYCMTGIQTVVIRFPSATNVTMPVVSSTDFSSIQYAANFILDFGPNCVFSVSASSVGIPLRKPENDSVYILTAAGSSTGIKISYQNTTYTVPMDYTSIIIGNYECIDTTGSGTSLRMVKRT